MTKQRSTAERVLVPTRAAGVDHLLLLPVHTSPRVSRSHRLVLASGALLRYLRRNLKSTLGVFCCASYCATFGTCREEDAPIFLFPPGDRKHAILRQSLLSMSWTFSQTENSLHTPRAVILSQPRQRMNVPGTR